MDKPFTWITVVSVIIVALAAAYVFYTVSRLPAPRPIPVIPTPPITTSTPVPTRIPYATPVPHP